jgi:ribose transport system substrate-binding protein
MKKRILSLSVAAALAIISAAPAYAAETYGFSNIGLSFPFAAAIAKGFTDAAKAAGVDAVVLDAKNDVQKQANDIDDLIAQKVKGIVVMPLDSTVAQGWVDKVDAAGIPIASVGSQIGDPNKRAIKDVYPKLVAVVTQDEIAAGNRAGELAMTLLPKDHVAKIAIIEGQAGFSEVKQRSDGFLEALKKAGAKYEIVASQPGDWTAEKGEAACQNILAAHPDVDLFFNQADDMVVGCARAVKSGGSSAKLIGFGGSKLAIAAIKDGAVDGTVCYKPEELGKLAFQAVYDAAHGKGEHGHQFITYNTPGVTKATVDQCVGQW